MNSPLWIYCVGFAAQLFFTARVLVQWYLSEKHRKVESPMLFWLFSIVGSLILLWYGWLRRDLAILIGECISFYIYLWNLRTKGLFDRMPRVVPLLVAVAPLFAVGLMLARSDSFTTDFFRDAEVTGPLLCFGIAGQIVFKSRFLFQWFYSVRHGESSLPMSFWILSVAGSLMIIVYGLIRHDWVLVAGQIGIVASVRNIMIALAHRKNEDPV
ncbi:MAG: lipid-A-disaccharide synthase N-terminal domain-containing protein [Bacteroidales bacterium]|nr:lipid-A-disaccharide synthase N-terminal domain-containing protein [Bacteroidales bacterium]